jgi:hypothetical protein
MKKLKIFTLIEELNYTTTHLEGEIIILKNKNLIKLRKRATLI